MTELETLKQKLRVFEDALPPYPSIKFSYEEPTSLEQASLQLWKLSVSGQLMRKAFREVYAKLKKELEYGNR